VTAGVATFTSDGSANNSAYQGFATVPGQAYIARWTRTSGGAGLVRIGASASGAEFLNQANTAGAFAQVFVATTALTYISFGYGVAAVTTIVDDLSVKALTPEAAP
jgi:hypothetical protein